LSAFLAAVWETVVALAPSLMFGLLIAGVLHVFVSREKVLTHLGKPGFKSVLKASVIGVPLPLCSCGVLPAALGLRKDGASLGAATSFLVSTPQTGVDSIVATWGVLGWPVALTKVVAAFLAGVVSGTIVDASNGEGTEARKSPPTCVDVVAGGRLKRIWDYTFGSIFRDIYRWLFLGIVISALIVVFVEPGTLGRFTILRGPLGLLAALAVGIPLYVCSLASIPIAAALVYAGFPVGGALVFLMAGPATNAATMGAVFRVMGGRVFWTYLTTVIVVSLAAGLLLNNLEIPAVTGIHHGDHGGAFGILGLVTGILLSAGIVYWGVRDAVMGIASMSREGDRYLFGVEGMSCMSCVARVRDALTGLEGAGSVEVSLDEARAEVRADDRFDPAAAIDRVNALGFDCSRLTTDG